MVLLFGRIHAMKGEVLGINRWFPLFPFIGQAFDGHQYYLFMFV